MGSISGVALGSSFDNVTAGSVISLIFGEALEALLSGIEEKTDVKLAITARR